MDSRLPALFCRLCLLLVTPVALAQVNTMPTVPRDPDADDLREVDDVERDGDDPMKDGTGQGGADESDAAWAERLHDEELRFTEREIRNRFDYSVALLLGSGRPWQTFGMEAGFHASDALSAGFFAGGGRSDDGGILDDKAYNMGLNSRSAGLSARYHFARVETASVEALLGYAAWDGIVSPFGSSESMGDTAEKLSASFRAHGPFVGVSSALTWRWTRGFFLQWTVVGVQKSLIASKDLTRTAPLVDKVLAQTIERPAFFGLSNLKFGWMF